MSSKIAKDEQIDIHSKLDVEASSEEVAELLFTRAIDWIKWRDIIACSYVCKGWSRFISGPLVAHSSYAKRFKEAHTDEESLVRFYQWRAARDDKTHEQCLLLVLEAQMLLRELAEYQKVLTPSDKLFTDIRDQLTKLSFGEDEEAELLAKISKLRNELVSAFARNEGLEKDLKKLEHTIGLLIQHRASIYELDRARFNKQKKATTVVTELPPIHKNPALRQHYSNLFFLIRT